MHVLMFPTIVNGPFGLDILMSNQKDILLANSASQVLGLKAKQCENVPHKFLFLLSTPARLALPHHSPHPFCLSPTSY